MISRTFRHSTSFLLVSSCAAALATLAPACSGSSTESAAGSGGSAGDGGSGGSPGTGGRGGMGGIGGSAGSARTVELVVQVFETNSISPADLGDGLAEVSVCEDGTENCALSDASGTARIMVPAGREIGYTMRKEGYISYLAWDVTDETFVGLSSNWPMFTESQVEEIAAQVEINYPLQGSFLILGAVPFREGVTFELIGETAKSYYHDEDGFAQLDLTETTSDGRGGFVDIPPGEHEVELGGNVANCRPSIAPDSDTPNRITVAIREGFHTYASMNCETP